MDLSELDRLEKQVETIKLSAAIRIGARMHPQAFDVLWDGVGTCAMGAANMALHGSPYYPPGGLAALRLPQLIVNEIVYRNNYKHQTREQIADWLADQGL